MITNVNELARELIAPLDTSDLLADVRRALAVYTFQLASLFPTQTNWGGKSFGKHPTDTINVGRRLAAARLLETVIANLRRRNSRAEVQYLSHPMVRSLFEDEIWTPGHGLKVLCNVGLIEFQKLIKTQLNYAHNIRRLINFVYPGTSIAKVEPNKKRWLKQAKELFCSVAEFEGKKLSKKYIQEPRGLENHINFFEATSALLFLFLRPWKHFKIPDLTCNDFGSELLSMTAPDPWNEIIADHDHLAKHLQEIGMRVPIFALPTVFHQLDLNEPAFVTKYFDPKDG